MVLFSLTGAGITITHHLQYPDSPVFIYSILSKSSYFKNPLFLTLSTILHTLFMIYELGFMVQHVSGCLNFCRVLESCLNLMSFESREKFAPFELLVELDQALIYYKRLDHLVKESNKLFAWNLAIIMGGYSLMGCIVAFLPLHYWDSNSPLMLGYIFLFVTMMYIFCRTIPGMGKVYEVSKSFRVSWLRGVSYSKDSLNLVVEQGNYFKLLKLRLQSCIPFGFKCGNFFYIKTSTILTFFSAIATYVIILLQLDI